MDLPVRGTTSTRELEELNAGKAPLLSASKPSTKQNEGYVPLMNKWLNESTTDAPWVPLLLSDICYDVHSRKPHRLKMVKELTDILKTGVPSSRQRFRQNQPYHLPDRISEADITPSLSDGSSHNEEDQTAAGVLQTLSSWAAEVLHDDEQTDGQDHGPPSESHGPSSAGKEAETEKSKGKRTASTGREVSNSQDDPYKQVTEPKRLKVAKPPTRAGGRFFACLFFKRDANYCQNTHCAGRSTASVETVIRHWLQKHLNQGDLDAETHKNIKDMKKKYNMSVPGQDEELWIVSYMTLFRVSRNDVPSPFVSPDVDDLSTVLARRLNQQPAFATELVAFFDEDAAMRRRHEQGREEIRRTYEAIEADRTERVRFETRAELTVATQQHEDVCRHERESFKNKFKASLTAGVPSGGTGDHEGDGTPAGIESQELRGTNDTRTEGSIFGHQSYDSDPTSNINFTDSGYGSNESYCFNCSSISFVDSKGFCVGCDFLQPI